MHFLSRQSLRLSVPDFLKLLDYSRPPDSEAVTLALHDLLYSLVSRGVILTGEDRWQLPVLCYLTISALREDGSFLSAELYTPLLAKWEYFLRMVHFTQAFQMRLESGGVLLEYVVVLTSPFAFPHLFLLQLRSFAG